SCLGGSSERARRSPRTNHPRRRSQRRRYEHRGSACHGPTSEDWLRRNSRADRRWVLLLCRVAPGLSLVTSPPHYIALVSMSGEPRAPHLGPEATRERVWPLE